MAENEITRRANEAISTAKIRAVYEYKVPPEVANGIDKVALVKLTAREEMMATSRARNDAIRLAYELAKSSLVEVNGEVIDKTNGDDDVMWESMDPLIRDLVMTAYGDLHSTPTEVAKSFLDSRTIRA